MSGGTVFNPCQESFTYIETVSSGGGNWGTQRKMHALANWIDKLFQNFKGLSQLGFKPTR